MTCKAGAPATFPGGMRRRCGVRRSGSCTLGARPGEAHGDLGKCVHLRAYGFATFAQCTRACPSACAGACRCFLNMEVGLVQVFWLFQASNHVGMPYEQRLVPLGPLGRHTTTAMAIVASIAVAVISM